MKAPKIWRQSAVCLHILTSAGWMTLAVVLFTLLAAAAASGDPAVRVGALSMAELIDRRLLATLANASAFTGFLLCATTPWGFFRHWWVLAKFAITIVQLNAGIILLSPTLDSAEAAVRAGDPLPSPVARLAGIACMASAMAFQAWLSQTKPWRRTPWSPAAKPVQAPARAFAAAVIAPLTDIAVGMALGFPLPVLSAAVLVVLLVRRRRRATLDTLSVIGDADRKLSPIGKERS